MNTTTPRPTPETDAEVKDFDAPWLYYVNADFARKLERERDEAREELQQWKMLCAWGGTPFHIDQFIKGQQMRIYEAQDIEETCEQLERERDERREYAERCKEGCIKLSFAIDRIDYACGNPNEMEVSDYALHQNEEHVVQRVKEKLEAMREAIKEAHGALKAIDDLHNWDFPSGGEFSDTAIEAFNRGNVALAKLQAFIKP